MFNCKGKNNRKGRKYSENIYCGGEWFVRLDTSIKLGMRSVLNK